MEIKRIFKNNKHLLSNKKVGGGRHTFPPPNPILTKMPLHWFALCKTENLWYLKIKIITVALKLIILLFQLRNLYSVFFDSMN